MCTARNSAELDGLLTVFHTERSADTLQNVQNDLPILTDYDKQVRLSLSDRLDTCTWWCHSYPLAGEVLRYMWADAELQGSFSNGSGEAMPRMLTVLLHLQALKALLAHFEVDFVSLSFVREGEDVHQAREFLDSLGHTTTKVQRLSPAGRAFKSWPPGACMLHAGCPAGSMPVLLDVTLLGH